MFFRLRLAELIPAPSQPDAPSLKRAMADYVLFVLNTLRDFRYVRALRLPAPTDDVAAVLDAIDHPQVRARSWRGDGARQTVRIRLPPGERAFSIQGSSRGWCERPRAGKRTVRRRIASPSVTPTRSITDVRVPSLSCCRSHSSLSQAEQHWLKMFHTRQLGTTLIDRLPPLSSAHAGSELAKGASAVVEPLVWCGNEDTSHVCFPCGLQMSAVN